MFCSVLFYRAYSREAQQNRAIHIEEKQKTVSAAKTTHTHRSVLGAHIDREPVEIAPIFVLSDVHVHYERVRSGSLSSIPTAGIGASHSWDDSASTLPLQPLLDKDHSIRVQDGVAVVLHSTQKVLGYSRTQADWTPVDFGDIDSVVAEGISVALAGLQPPHKALLETEGVFDSTWTYGMHPFHPYGTYVVSPSKELVLS